MSEFELEVWIKDNLTIRCRKEDGVEGNAATVELLLRGQVISSDYFLLSDDGRI